MSENSENTVKKAPEAMAVGEGRPNEQGSVFEEGDLVCFQEGSVWLNSPAEFLCPFVPFVDRMFIGLGGRPPMIWALVTV